MFTSLPTMHKLDALKKYGAVFLLLLAVCLQGAKTPLAFSIWGTAGLLLCLGLFLDAPGTFVKQLTPLPLLVLCLIGTSHLFSLDPAASLFQTVKMLVFFFIWLALRSHPEWMAEEKLFWRMLAALGLLTVLYTLYQIIRGPNPATGVFEVHGFLPVNPSFNAIWMASLSAAFIARVLTKGFQSRADRYERVIELALGVLLAVLVLANPARTRSAPLALGVALLYIFCTRYSFKRVLLGGLVAGGIAFAVLPIDFLEAHMRISGTYREPNYRTRIWGIAIKSAGEHPWTGSGPGNFELAYQKYAFPVREDFVRYARTTQFAHNEYLQVAADMGLPAFGALLLILFRVFKTPAARWPSFQRPAKAALLALCCDALFTLTWQMPLLLYLTILWSLVLLQPSLEVESVREPARNRGWVLGGALLIAGGLECLLVYSAVRYVWAAQGNWAGIVRWNPKDASAWHALGGQMKPGSGAVHAYQRAVALCPEQPYFHESLAAALELSPHPENIAQALQEYLIAFQQAPSRAIDALAIGRLYYRHGHMQPALAWFKKARDLEPRYWEAHLWIARGLLETGSRREALRALRRLPREYENFRAAHQKVIQGLRLYQPSGYERTILAYDQTVVNQELQRFLSHR
jgi:O-antigen ligase